MTDLMRPEDLKKVTSDAEMKKAAEHLKAAKKQEEEQKALLEMFMAREISPKASERINEAVRRAAEQGLNELQVITFASTYCNDRGRRINNNESDWPESLEGFAKKAYDYFDKELRPLGYKLRVQVIDYPGGVPGNIGFFLKW
jgi:flagellar biosynthesis/type III secretory pathway protein FliH